MEVNDGKYFEKIVWLIEQAIDPDSTVEHDVEMPILASQKGFTTQCDLVIRSGKYPNEVITLVEVQDRNSKVKPNDFRGWQQKLLEVGAQNLICVSRKKFPESIKEKAAQLGNAIKLIHLTDNTENIPLSLLKAKFKINFFDITNTQIENATVSTSQLESIGIIGNYSLPRGITINDKIYSSDQQNFSSLIDLCTPLIHKDISTSGHAIIKMDINSNPVYINDDGKLVKMGMDFSFDWIKRTEWIPIAILSYEQDEHGPLAWLLEITFKKDSVNHWIKIPVTITNNTFHIRSLEHYLPDCSLCFDFEDL